MKKAEENDSEKLLYDFKWIYECHLVNLYERKAIKLKNPLKFMDWKTRFRIIK